MKKTFKKFGLVFVAIMALFISTKVHAENTRPQTGQTFTFDSSYKLRLGELEKNNDGTYTVPVIGYSDSNEKLDLTGKDEVHYRITEINEETYKTIINYQVAIDNAIVEGKKPNVDEFQNFIKNNEWWCYDEFEVGTITLEAKCEKKYYIITVDALDTDTIEMANLNWNYHTARAYEVEANTDAATCKSNDTTTEENPKTGIATPYIICGTIALGSVAAIVLSKKKKYI